jgi:S-DNA-T family DNA segregation ATPase FtsK/SpoIIIE
MTESFSVTDIRVAFECPRLFYLGKRHGGMTMFLPSETSFGIGNKFHDLSNEFISTARKESQFQHLFDLDPSNLKVDDLSLQLQQLFYELVFSPYLQEIVKVQPEKAQALHLLWQALKRLISRWAEQLIVNRRYCSASEVVNKTFLGQELNVKHYFGLPDGSEQLVRGKFDSLVYDFEHHRLCVVEYKTYQSVDQTAQVAQVALYGFMLQEKVGLPINSALYSVLPDWKETTFTWQQLANTVHQLIPGRLQQMKQWITWEQRQPNPPPTTSQPDRLCKKLFVNTY